VLVWDETDLLTCLEVEPEVEADGIWHKYSVKRNDITLNIHIYQYDGDVHFELKQDTIELPLFEMKLIDCPGIKYNKVKSSEYLEFSHAKSFGSRHDGESGVKYGVRVNINPSIQISLF